MLYFVSQYENVSNCLNTLSAHSVGGLDAITTNDITSGRLKAILALFFALSRFKQANKQKIKQPSVNVEREMNRWVKKQKDEKKQKYFTELLITLSACFYVKYAVILLTDDNVKFSLFTNLFWNQRGHFSNEKSSLLDGCATIYALRRNSRVSVLSSRFFSSVLLLLLST